MKYLSIALIISIISLSAQVMPTNAVRITEISRLVWDGNGSYGYNIRSTLNTNVLFTTNTWVYLIQLSTNIQSGAVTFQVNGVDKFGNQGMAGFGITNMIVLPRKVENVWVPGN